MLYNFEWPTENTMAWLFLELAIRDPKTHKIEKQLRTRLEQYGSSRPVSRDEFVGKWSKLQTNNGMGWARSDQGFLGKRFNIIREREGGKVVSITLVGFKKNPFEVRINPEIRKLLEVSSCEMLGIRGAYIEIDHRDGRKDDARLSNIKTQRPEDFMALHKASNVAKRSHCKECRKTGIRFDATRLGFPIAQFVGPKEYKGSCIGCFWNGPREFRQQVYKKITENILGKVKAYYQDPELDNYLELNSEPPLELEMGCDLLGESDE